MPILSLIFEMWNKQDVYRLLGFCETLIPFLGIMISLLITTCSSVTDARLFSLPHTAISELRAQICVWQLRCERCEYRCSESCSDTATLLCKALTHLLGLVHGFQNRHVELLQSRQHADVFSQMWSEVFCRRRGACEEAEVLVLIIIITFKSHSASIRGWKVTHLTVCRCPGYWGEEQKMRR